MDVNKALQPSEELQDDCNLLLSQLLLSQIPQKEQEKTDNTKNPDTVPKDQYLCPKCLTPHEIFINTSLNEVELKCSSKSFKNKYSICDFLDEITKTSYFYYKCEICKKNIQKNFKIEDDCIFKYCYQCNKIICMQCLDFSHPNHKNVIASNQIFNKCSEHFNEDYEYFCINCNIHLCKNCPLNLHKKHRLIKLVDIFPTKAEINRYKEKKNEFIIQKEILLKQIRDLDNLINLSDIIFETYEKHNKNYFYIKNVVNAFDGVNQIKKIDIPKSGFRDRTNSTGTSKNDNQYGSNNKLKYIKVSKYDKQNLATENSFDNIISQKNTQKKELKDILLNLVKKKEIMEKEVFLNQKVDYKELRKIGRKASSDIKTDYKLDKGEDLLSKFNKEYGMKIFANKKKVELWGVKMGKDGLMVLLNNKNKFNCLEELILGRIKLNSIDFLEDIIVKNLLKLDLEFNKITNLDLLTKLNIHSLEKLNLSNNSISNIDILSKISMPNLLILNLSRNRINSIDVFAKVKFPKLRGLFLSENNISNIQVLKNVEFNQLTELYLNSNSISSIDVLKETKFPNLKLLNLNTNKVLSIDALTKFQSYKIEEINLRMNCISNIEALSKVNFPFLKGLLLDNNRITNIDCLGKCKLPLLQRIYLENNYIENINVFMGNIFPKLDTLTLAGNKINFRDKNTKKIIEDLENKKIYVSR